MPFRGLQACLASTVLSLHPTASQGSEGNLSSGLSFWLLFVIPKLGYRR